MDRIIARHIADGLRRRTLLAGVTGLAGLGLTSPLNRVARAR